MKILKHGDTAVLRKLNNFVQFHCQTCHCIFEADHSEYNRTFHYGLTTRIEAGFYTATCPDCHRHVIESIPADEVQAYERERCRERCM